MSMSIENLARRLYFTAVPLIFLVSSCLAVWYGMFQEPGDRVTAWPVPHFEFHFKDRPLPTPSTAPVSISEGERDIFKLTPAARKEERDLVLQEIALGLVITTAKQKYCKTNGILFSEGSVGNGFIVHRIEEDGVWYKIGDTMLFLNTGEKVNVDALGKVWDGKETTAQTEQVGE